MPCACRKHDHIAGACGHDDAAIPAELDCDLAAVNAERLVCVGMKMMERVDAIAPGGGSLIAVE